MKKLFLIPLMIVLVSGLVLSGCAAPAPAPTPAPAPAPTPPPAPAVKPVELSFAYHVPPVSGASRHVLIPWAEKVEKATNGRVKIVHYPAQSLCKIRETLEATKAGRADITWVVFGAVYPGRFPVTSVTSLPLLNVRSGTVDGRTLTLGGINSYILQRLYETVPEIQAEWKDWKVLFLFGSPVSIFTAPKPVRTLEDFKGLKLKAFAGPTTEMCENLGAAPVRIGTPEMYGALQKGVIDGCMQSYPAVLTNKFYEILRYRTTTEITVSQMALIMNKDKWNSLDPDIQEAIMSVSGTNGAEFAGETEWGLAFHKVAKGKIKEAGYEIEEVDLDPAELERWKETAAKPLYDKWVADMAAKGLPGQKILDEARRLMEKVQTN